VHVQKVWSLSLILLTALGLSVFAGAAAAQESKGDKPAPSQYKIGVVDLQQLLADYDKRKDKYDELQKEVDELQKDIDAMSGRITKAKQEYEEKRDTISEEERLEMKNKIEDDYAQYRIELDKRQRLIDNKEESVLKEVFKDIQAAISRVATAENYHLVLNAKGGPRGSVLYHAPAIDITSKVLTTLNAM